MGTGGSLSRTGVSVGAGANSRWGGVFSGILLGVILLLFGSSAEKVPLAVIGGMLVVIGIELIMARVPSAKLVLSTGEWGPIAAMVITFVSALFIPLQDTIFLGAGLSLLLYVVASSRKLRLQEGVHQEDGSWVMQDAPKSLTPNQATVLVVQGLDFFAEVPTLEDQMPSSRDVKNAVVVLVIRDMHTISSTGIRWMQHYFKELQANGGTLILADVNMEVYAVLKKSGALAALGEENVIPATARVLDAENQAWEVAQKRLTEIQKAS
jgi:SulP family sulfate permease